LIVDKATVGGVLIGLGGIFAGLLLEGGNLSQILQPTAAMIVFGGTLGAILIQFPLPIVLSAFRRLAHIFSEPKSTPQVVIQELVRYAYQARREGIVSLDAELNNIEDPFLKKALMLAVDGTEPEELRKIMELELDSKAETEEKFPSVFESAGGFSPTIGIIGAVLGLIQVMQHLDKIDEVGRGIAVAFVATIYGVGAANLFFLPAAGKLKIRIREEQVIREMTLEGVVSILEGMNPRMLETKLVGFLADASPVLQFPDQAKAASHGA
jgi:chemotaxis protein MotA